MMLNIEKHKVQIMTQAHSVSEDTVKLFRLEICRAFCSELYNPAETNQKILWTPNLEEKDERGRQELYLLVFLSICSFYLS